MTDIGVVTVLFDNNKIYFQDYLNSLMNQSLKKFSLLILNEKIRDIYGRYNLGELDHIIIDVTGPTLKNRIKGLKIAKTKGFKKIIFSDSDDLMTENRVEIISERLNKYEVVCNDLELIDSKGKSITSNYWLSRLSPECTFDSKFLIDKNILGFGNTGIRADIYNFKIKPLEINAPDWYFFTLLMAGRKALFTSITTTKYRQHSNNQAGLIKYDFNRIKKCLETKIQLYNSLSRLGYKGMNELLKQQGILLSHLKIMTNDEILDYISTHLRKPLFWWEESNYLL